MNKTNDSVVFLTGKHVNLRPVMKADVPLLTRWINDPEIRLFLTVSMPMFEKDEENWFDKVHSRKPNDIVFTITLKSGKSIGLMGIHRINWIDGTATTGAFIGEKSYWGKGYGSEAKELLLAYAFETLNLRKIQSRVIAFNKRSIRYSEKCGYKIEGTLREQIYKEGKYWDEVLMAVFKADWLKRKLKSRP